MIPPKVTTIVLNWRSRDTIEACLESLLVQTYASHEIIFVDNASQDGSLELLRKKYGGKVRILENAVNLGFSGGVNQGIRASKSDYVALLNADATALPDWIAALVRGLESSEKIGMVTSKVYLWGQEKVLDNTGNDIYRDACAKPRGRFEQDRGQYDSKRDVGYASGCAAMYRRSLFDAIGLFDERMFAYGEDMDLAIRARLAGYACAFVPEAVVYHHLSGSLGAHSALKLYYVERNRLWTVLKCFPWPYLVAAPFYTLWRIAHHLVAFLMKQGPGSEVLGKVSAMELIGAVLRAYASTAVALFSLFRERRRVFAKRRISNKEFGRVFKGFLVTAKDIAFRRMFP